jgi:hypothetical protein
MVLYYLLGQYIGLLLLIVPGFACRNFYGYLNSGQKDEDGLRLTISSLIYSVWVLVINYMILSPCFHIKTLSGIMDHFNQGWFVILYIGITIISCLIITFLLDFIHPKYTVSLLNRLRKEQGKVGKVASSSIWDKVFQDPNNLNVIIEQNQKLIAQGKIKYFNPSSNNRRELYLLSEEEIQQDSKIRGVYVDCETNLVIKIIAHDK